ncbi:protein translocase subunit SecD [Elysia marginata]|uniref:Protein translocase subunit SecD n=1 Tax=Elysia marginata TaxID=1093978 RepID=A0AAV4FNV6_9GAST|nr:protein translocase subunit SecD [Elysia marginata]
MEGKGLVKLFGFLFGVVSLYQLSFTYISNETKDRARVFAKNKVSEDEDNYVEERRKKELHYLDSVSGETVYDIGITSFTYKEVEEKELNKGLDLKGGINVILQISVKDILRGLANYSKDPTFNNALVGADKASEGSDSNYVDLFFEIFENIGENVHLASPSIFATKSLSGDITFDMSNDDVKPIIREKVNASIVSAFEVLRKRIDRFGVTQPNIQRLGNSGRILVELPGAKDIDRVKKLLKSTAQLEFWFTKKNVDVLPFLVKADEMLQDILPKEKSAVKEEAVSELDSLLSDVANDSLEGAKKRPLLDLIVDQSFEGAPILGAFAIKDTATVNGYLKIHQIRTLLTETQKDVKFVWGKPKQNLEVVNLYALEYNRQGRPPLSGSVIENASQTYDINNNPAVSMQMNGKGSRIWEEMTGRAYKERSNIAIVLDNVVYSAPSVSSGSISGGRSEITGDFTLNEAVDLANVLRAGKLPASAEIVQSEIVGPSLGQEAIDNGINSFIIAMIIVLVWMMAYYGIEGFFANIALLFNIVLIFGVLAGLGAVLTLPGIAGIVLTIGMSVDANVIIFERIKEEIKKGKSQARSIADGFNNALSSILDANITTGLTAIILLVFGTGPIRGFATTLIIGILTSLFTAVFISRLLIESRLSKKRTMTFDTPVIRKLIRETKINFLGARKVAYIVSGLLILASLISLSTKGLNQGVDFLGGRSYQVRFEEKVSPQELSFQLKKALGSVEVKTFGSPNQVKITTKYKVEENGDQIDNEIQTILFQKLQKYLPEGSSYDTFINPGEDKHVGIMSSIKVGPTIADDIKINSFWSVLGSLAVVFLYILMRFQKWQYSVGAVIAVFHDVMLVLGVFSLTYSFMPFGMEIDQAFIAAILTVIGYSLNDTVIVFDRIREYTGLKIKENRAEIINTSLNSTLGRTLNTSLTTMVVLLSIFLLGGDSLRGFIFAMIIGIAVGTYSSLFIATPVLYDFEKKNQKKKV